MADAPGETRIAAYACAMADQQILLTRLSGRDEEYGRWTLPGGGLDWGEDPVTALHRELWEETGLAGTIEGLLGVDSRVYPAATRRQGDSLHAIRILYRVTAMGTPRVVETDGSTDAAAWVSLSAVAGLDTVDLVDIALGLANPG